MDNLCNQILAALNDQWKTRSDIGFAISRDGRLLTNDDVASLDQLVSAGLAETREQYLYNGRGRVCYVYNQYRKADI